MRLRLHLERNALPPTLALFPVPNPTKTTIAQLLQTINLVFPLESETWGLEDYSVSINGFECLHYHTVCAVCRDDDEVTIRPLQWLDVRSRRLAGREQITADGRHLVDGVPWGRVALKAVDRPEVKIPPRKKRRIMEEGEEEEEGEAGQLQITEAGEEKVEDDGEDDEMDEDFGSVDDASTSTSEDNSESSGSEESDGESSSESGSDTDDTSSSDSDDSSTDASDSDAPSIAPSKPVKASTAPKAKPKNALPTTNGLTETTGTKRKRSVSFEDGLPRKSDIISSVQSLPGEGHPQTRTRNARRRDAHKLRVLKERGELPVHADLHDMRRWMVDNPDGWSDIQASLQVDTAPARESIGAKGGTAPPVAELTNGVIHHEAVSGDVVEEALPSEVTESKSKKKKKKKRADHSELVKPEDPEQKRQQLLDAIRSGGIDVTEASKPSKQTKQATAGSMQGVADQVMVEEEMEFSTPLAESSQVTPGRRLDIASTQRLLFGSLGLRVPKTQADREKLQQKLAAKATRPKIIGAMNGSPQDSAMPNGIVHSEHAAEPAEIDGGHDSWRSKISLGAVECVVEGLTLSTPPFPFHQRWDKSLKKKMAGRSSQGSNGPYQASNTRKRKRSGHVEETYDKYNTNGNGDALEYDDVEEHDDLDDEYWEEGALLHDNCEESDIEDDGFPDLPTNLNALPSLLEKDAELHDFIAYTELAVDESTAWEPKSVTRLAKIVDSAVPLDNDPLLWTLELSRRDRKQMVFDQDGNRVYAKFEMPDEDGEREEDGRKEVSWGDLGDVKLVQRGSQSVNGGAVEEVGE